MLGVSGVPGGPQEWRFVLLGSVLGEEAPWGAGLQAEFPSWVVTQPRSEAGNLRLRCRRNTTSPERTVLKPQGGVCAGLGQRLIRGVLGDRSGGIWDT